MSRLSWDEYFMKIAEVVALRADCSRRQVGAVIVNSRNRIIATGYNGSPPGFPECLSDSACPRGNSGLPHNAPFTGSGFCIAIHAEENAILEAGRDRTQGATLYITLKPCPQCSRVLESAGLSRIVYPEPEEDNAQVSSRDGYGSLRVGQDQGMGA